MVIVSWMLPPFPHLPTSLGKVELSGVEGGGGRCGTCYQRREETRSPTQAVTQGSNRPFLTFSLGTLVARHTIQIQLDLYPHQSWTPPAASPHQQQQIKEIKGCKYIFIAAGRAS